MLGERGKRDRKPTGRKRERGKVAERRKKKEEPEGGKSVRREVSETKKKKMAGNQRIARRSHREPGVAGGSRSASTRASMLMRTRRKSERRSLCGPAAHRRPSCSQISAN